MEFGEENSVVEASFENKEVHFPAENLREKKATEEFRRKLDERREKRQIEKKLAQVCSLAHAASDDDSVVNWVEKSRRIQKDKDEAKKRAKMLEEMDGAFGVKDLVTAELIKQKAYTSRDLQGIKVEHGREMIAEGKEVVLTLKDQNILQEGDVLINVNLVDIERYKKNNEIKKQRPGPGYQPCAEEGMDELGLPIPKPKLVLAKYDTEIEGEKHDSFVLGKIAGNQEAKKLMKDKLKLQQKKIESLGSGPLRIASEYYTAEEMISFKKVKRRVKKIQSNVDGILKADDDLIQETQEGTILSDLGTSSRKKKINEDAPEDLSSFKITTDESQKEICQALLKANQLKERKIEQWNIIRSKKREILEETKVVDEDHLKSSIILNATAEFCRILGDIPTYGMAGNRDEDEDELMDFERQLAKERRRNQEIEERKREAERLQDRGGWNVLLERENDQGSGDSMDIDRNEKEHATLPSVILDEEPNVGSGMAAALKLAMSKGYLEKEEEKRIVISKSAQELQAQRYTIEDKTTEDDKYSRRNRLDGPIVEFKGKEGYKPLPKLEYTDDNGKAMSTKEAFRHLSHKFHGKGSGKLKSEKRAQKDEDKMLMNRMSSIDTPLNTLKRLQDKQREMRSPYVILSGKKAP